MLIKVYILFIIQSIIIIIANKLKKLLVTKNNIRNKRQILCYIIIDNKTVQVI